VARAKKEKLEELKEKTEEEKTEEEKTEEQDYFRKENFTDTLYIRLTNRVYRILYRIAKENNVTMSEIGRLCIENNLMNVSNLLKEIRDLKYEFIKK